MSSATLRTTLLYLSLQLVLVSAAEEQLKLAAEQPSQDNGASADLEADASSDSIAALENPNSHRIVASGWPSTSPLWPSIDTADGANQSASLNWPQMIEPFILADKPRSVDYSLLLTMNKTISDSLKNLRRPIAVTLSFEFYFNFDPKVTALPGIKIEIDRKQFRYLEPTLAPGAANSIAPKVWTRFQEQILVTDALQLDNHDWLKFSLVNRQAPSIVAIRRLRAELSTAAATQPPQVLQPTGGDSAAPVTPTQQAPTPPIQQNEIAPINPPQPPPPEQQAPVAEQVPAVDPGSQYPPAQQSPGLQDQQAAPPLGPPVDQRPQLPAEPEGAGSEVDQVTAASDALTTTIKPVKAKGKSWVPTIPSFSNPFGRRKRRQVGAAPQPEPMTVIFTCYQRESCEWRADGSEDIQWSSARMPPSTVEVQTGYYYVSSSRQQPAPEPSNDAQQVQRPRGRLLRLSLNQTEAARIKDQNSDHCIELALYITERATLNMYRLTRSAASSSQEESDAWEKGNLVLNWAPTMIAEVRRNDDGTNATMAVVRNSLPRSRLPAIESGQNGWTLETICFGDFFSSVKECGLGNCAFGFEMDLGDSTVGGAEQQQVESSAPEQVVGVSLRNEYSVKPKFGLKQPVRWLQTWQRSEVQPEDNWKFYPRMDLSVSDDNLTLLNTYDGAHYYLQSDWLLVGEHLDFSGSLLVELNQTATNSSIADSNANSVLGQPAEILTSNGEMRVFAISLISRLVDAKFASIHSSNSTIEWSTRDNSSLSAFSLDMPITELLRMARQGELANAHGTEPERSLFKIVLEIIFEVKFGPSGFLDQFLGSSGSQFGFHVANVSLADRCHPSPCQFGSCHQNGTGPEDWECRCDDGKHRGRRCEFGRWCELAHVTPWVPPTPTASQEQQQQRPAQQQPQQTPVSSSAAAQPAQTIGVKRSLAPKSQHVVVAPPPPPPAAGQNKRGKLIESSAVRISGNEYCQRKLGSGSKCTEIDLALNDNLYTEDEKTFSCSCQDDYYLSDDAKCKQAHPCNSIVCPAIGMICDETKPFNRTQPCVCNEKQDWHLDPSSLKEHQAPRCVRRQCQDIQRDCGFDAHLCLPTLPGERPICKCGPNFALKLDDKTGRRYCQSTACVLPTLNDCQQICVPDNENRAKPYRCECHAGYQRDPDDEAKCRPLRPEPQCRPACHGDTQVCTDLGCRCKQGYLGEGEVTVKQVNRRLRSQSGNVTTIDYVQSVRCLNVCSLTYAENKREFEMIESVCPLGLCDPSTFQCRCYDPSSSALVNTKYEPIYANSSAPSSEAASRQRVSPLCHLRRVCEPDSISFKICRSQGAICVPDYTKAAMFDCICPPSTEKRLYGQGSSSEFTCEPKCSSVKYECLRRQAVCRLVDQDSVRCDCLPGHMFDPHDHKCYLARYSYALDLILVNRYYEPESKFHRLERVASANQSGDEASRVSLFEANNQNLNSELSEVVPQFVSQAPALNQPTHTRSKFIVDYNQCNITQVIPKDIIEDPYEHDIESYLSYIDQCNERIHQNVKSYHLNSKLAEDLRQSLQQHLRGFTVTTSNSSCRETDQTGAYLNCTVYLQSNEQIPAETVDLVLNNCDRNGQDDRFCWIKPRLLLRRLEQAQQAAGQSATRAPRQQLNFRQVIPCELDNFCGPDAFSVRLDEHTSLCSCKCPPDIEVVDVRDLERRLRPSDAAATSHGGVSADYHAVAAKEICAPRNHCATSGANSTFCLGKSGSVCHYDVRLGSRCQCVYPSYENEEGRCVEVAFSALDDTLIVLIVLLGTGLIVSIAVNLFALAKSQRLFSQSKEYPLSEFPTTNSSQIHSRGERLNRSTGVPNLAFDND